MTKKQKRFSTHGRVVRISNISMTPNKQNSLAELYISGTFRTANGPGSNKTSCHRIQIHHSINITSKTRKESSQTPSKQWERIRVKRLRGQRRKDKRVSKLYRTIGCTS